MLLKKSKSNESSSLFPAAEAGIRNVIVQRKLAIGSRNDPLEHEADSVADKVMRMPQTAVLQRKCAECEEEEKVHRKPMEQFLQRKQLADEVMANDSISNKISSGKANGRDMDSNTKTFMESRFATDFSGIKIHTDSEAIQMADELNARAFTVASDIYFNKGQYDPNSNEGKHLLAHELTHTIQQGGSGLKIDRVKNTHGFINSATSISDAPVMISKGEKWDAFWDVGPYDAYKAKKIADYSLAAARKTGLPGQHNGAADAWRHCFWNCEMTKDIGRDQAKSIADNHEKHGGGPDIENLMDKRNNWEGRECGEAKGGCDMCCQDKLDRGTLDIIVGGKMVPSQKVARTTGEQDTSYYNK